MKKRNLFRGISLSLFLMCSAFFFNGNAQDCVTNEGGTIVITCGQSDGCCHVCIQVGMGRPDCYFTGSGQDYCVIGSECEIVF
jgi:hypothetical protein